MAVYGYTFPAWSAPGDWPLDRFLAPFQYMSKPENWLGGPDGTMFHLIREAVDPQTPWRHGQEKIARMLGDTIRAAAFHDDGDAGAELAALGLAIPIPFITVCDTCIAGQTGVPYAISWVRVKISG